MDPAAISVILFASLCFAGFSRIIVNRTHSRVENSAVYTVSLTESGTTLASRRGER